MKLSLHQVLTQLGVEDIENEFVGLATLSVTSSLPWYVRLFIGVSAWLAAAFLIGFLFLAKILQGREEMAVVGLVFCAIAVGINRAVSGFEFSDQLALALSMAGQALCVFGLYFWIQSTIGVILVFMTLECVLIALYRERVHRFLSTVAIIGAMLSLIGELHMPELIHVLIGALAIATLVFYWRDADLVSAGMEELAYPVRYGITASFLGFFVLPLTGGSEARWWWLTTGILFVTLVFLVVLIARDSDLELSGWVPIGLLAACGIALIPAIRMPAILGGALLVLLGFWRGQRLLMGLATISLLAYLGIYYYTLEWTLFVKSLVLLLCGLALLGLRYLLLHTRQARLIG
jgi:hypothetical protein